MKKTLLPLFICLVHALFGFGQDAEAPPLYFRTIGTEHGLSHQQVNCVLRDSRGFLWIGTQDGLNRYDGRTVTVFRHRKAGSNGISGNIIRDLLEDPDGMLWIATADGGLTRYDYRAEPENQFLRFVHDPSDPSSIPTNIVYALLLDPAGYVWLATGGQSVLRLDRKTFRFEKPVTQGTQTALDLCMDRAGVIWVGRQGGSFLKIHHATLQFEADVRYENLYAKLPHATVTSVFCDRDQRVWYGSWDKVLYRYDPYNRQEEVYRQPQFVEDDIISFAQDTLGRIWMGGQRHGLQIYDPLRRRFYSYRADIRREGALPGNQISCIYRDGNGIIWLGTDRGLAMYDPSRQAFRQRFLPKSVKGQIPMVYDFLPMPDGELLVGTSEGLYIRSASGDTWTQHPLQYRGMPLQVTKLFRDVDARLYIGTQVSVFEYDRFRGAVNLLPGTESDPVMKQLIESRITDLYRDTLFGEPVLMALPYGHYLSWYNWKEKRWHSRTDTQLKPVQQLGLKDFLIRKIYRHHSGQRWMATASAGLGFQESADEPVRYFRHVPADSLSLQANHIFDVCSGQDGSLWVSTYGGGLHRLDPTKKTFHHISGSDNLLEGIQVDAEGNVWVIASGDLHQYRVRDGRYVRYDLPDADRSGGVKGRIVRRDDGTLYVGGAGYFIEFQPSSIRSRESMPGVLFTDFRVFNQRHTDWLWRDEIELDYRQNTIQVDFAAPEYSGVDMQYEYKLEGWDRDWIEAGGRQSALYSNLGPGSYTFRVRATQTPGSWSPQEGVLQLRIVPPFWKTWWFYLSCIVLFTILINLVYRYRLNEWMKRQAIRNRIAQDLHDHVGSTLSSVSLYSQVAKIQHAQGRFEQAEKMLDKISSTSTDMISEMNDIVWAINPSNDTMGKIIERMENFARPLLSARGMKFTLQAEPAVKSLSLDMEQRKNLYLIFKEAVNNAVKYSGATGVRVHLAALFNELRMEITDNGRGFDVQKVLNDHTSLSGNGLRNMQQRAGEMGGELEISSSEKGTQLLLKTRG